MSLAAAPPPLLKTLTLHLVPPHLSHSQIFLSSTLKPVLGAYINGFSARPCLSFQYVLIWYVKSIFFSVQAVLQCHTHTHLIPFSPFKVTILGHPVIIGSIHPAEASMD